MRKGEAAQGFHQFFEGLFRGGKEGPIEHKTVVFGAKNGTVK
jgi:hypothetical protein